MKFRSTATLALALAAAAVPGTALAAGTLAGTSIQNTATVSFDLGGTPVVTSSNTTTLTVAELLDVDVTLQSSTVTVSAGATQQELVFRVTNTGNGPERFSLLAESVLTGDDFDPSPASPFLYFDTDSSGDLSAGDTPYVPGSNDPLLAPDASVVVLVVNDIPGSVTNGQRGRSQLAAAAATGTGTPGTVFAGQGEGGVDAVAGTSGGDDDSFGEYVVSDISLAAAKSQAVTDPFGGARPIPGARIAYEIVVTATGTGTATGAVFADLVPTGTTYVPGSLQLNGAPLTDAADADAGQFIASPAPSVRIALGDLTQADGPQTARFEVTINQ
jgi:uncharacterized repeat protein (TIGR01451 family)